ncbi:MAG TPA: MBL fold metallo-hydrolase [Azospirillaceae bacterium]|nr:MBL fold metallo-hydrolase [Azospirillaceae bacterium]
MSKQFASHADLEEKQVSFEQLSENAFAYTAEGDPNTGIIVGDDAVLVIDTQATPVMAQDVIRRIRAVTDKPVRHILLSHYHAVRVLGASAYGADQVIASQDTADLIAERGEADMASEIGRFPRLFRAAESIPGLTRPTLAFKGEMTLWLGRLEVRILQLGRGHSKGDTVAWLPSQGVLFAGDLVEAGATPYCGDAYFRDWPATLNRLAALQPAQLVPGRGPALTTPAAVTEAVTGTHAFVSELYRRVEQAVANGKTLRTTYQEVHAAMKPRFGHWVIFDHCMPFNVSRAFDEATGHAHPRIWTADRDREMWRQLEG